MKIAVIGAGAIGVNTAQALFEAGCEVHVFEQGSSAAQGASFAHSGNMGDGAILPLFGASFFKQMILATFKRPTTFSWRHSHAILAPKQYWQLLKTTLFTRKVSLAHTQADLNRLARYSKEVYDNSLVATELLCEKIEGALELHTVSAALDEAWHRAELDNLSIELDSEKTRRLDTEQMYAFEPALASDDALIGALYFPKKRYGNCALFTKSLKNFHQLGLGIDRQVSGALEGSGEAGSLSKGVKYWFNHTVDAIKAVDSRWQVQTDLSSPAHAAATSTSTPPMFDAVVIAAGVGSAPLLASLNLNPPTSHVHAYSVTMPGTLDIDAPKRCVVRRNTTEQTEVVFAPLGNRLRVTGQFQIGTQADNNSKAYKVLGLAAQRAFPYATKLSDAIYDVSTSCIAIDSKPIVGATPLAGIFTNYAHGPDHWALSFGCAQALSDLIVHTFKPSAKTAARFDLQPFSISRFS